jgi:hypothetical protein
MPDTPAVALPPLSYVDKLQRANALELAFFPLDALRRGLEQGRIVGVQENGDWAGYLWHGAVRAQRDVTIYQACIDYDARRQHLGFAMVREVLSRADVALASGVRLRCASTSDSNAFWAALGFYCVAVTEGGKSRKRDINEWRTDLQPGLFRLAVPPSARQMDRRDFYASLRTDAGSGLLSRFAHPTRVRETRPDA